MNRRRLLGTATRVAAAAAVAYVAKGQAVASATEITHGPTDRPHVALTFHGQGPPEVVTALLRALAEAHAQVTVLAVGSWLATEPTLARQILTDGHEIGNHTQHHLALADLPAGTVRREISACAAQIREVTGSIGTWFRPSQIQHATPLIREQAAAAGYRNCLSYDVDSLDYTDPGADAVVQTVLGAAHNGAIVSLHFGHVGTVRAIPAIIDGLGRLGLRPLTATELLRA
jgi:peptidoglycan/xylan/chitin deacetylase (PgdA/CDA1 family)